MHEIQVLLLTTALPILIKCLYNISSMMVYCRYSSYHGTICFFTESQYTDIPVISPAPTTIFR